MDETLAQHLSPSVLVNGRSVAFFPDETVADLVRRLGFDGGGIAVAQNAEVLPRSMWKNTKLQEEDVFEILSPQAGG